MHPGSIGAAEQRLAELRAALAQTGRQLKKARADQQRAQLALAREWQVSKWRHGRSPGLPADCQRHWGFSRFRRVVASM